MTDRKTDARAVAVATPLIDDARSRVTRFDFEPGAETGWHVHPLDYVIVALTEMNMTLELPGGEVVDTQIAAGESYARKAGTEHNVINAGDAAMSFVEMELK